MGRVIMFVDVILNMALVFIGSFVLAVSAVSESPEKTLPPLSLTRAEGGKAGSTVRQTVTISAQKDVSGAAKYFLDNSELPWEELKAALSNRAVEKVILRIDEALPTGTVIRLVALLGSLNITDVAFAYKAPSI